MVLLKRMLIGIGRKNQNYAEFFFIALDPVVDNLASGLLKKY